MTADVKKFFGRLSLFVPFFLVTVIFPTLVMWKAGELVSIDHVVEEQKKASGVVLFGPAYNGAMGYYSLKAISRRRPDVIALGSSRVMSFRSAFFTPEVSFYNAGGAAREIRHFREFIYRLPSDYHPKVIIAGLDQRYFNEEWIPEEDVRNLKTFYAPPNRSSMWMSALKKFLQDYKCGKFQIKDVFAPQPADYQKIGLSAIVNHSGTLNDGSHYYGKDISRSNGIFPQALEQIVQGTGYFAFGDKVSKFALDELDAFLLECQIRGIHVIGFLPPYAHSIQEAMLKSGRYKYLDQLDQKVEEVFKIHGFNFFDFSDLAKLGISDLETFDDHHASEKAYARLIIKMAGKDSILNKMVNIDHLQLKLRQSENPYTVFKVHEF